MSKEQVETILGPPTSVETKDMVIFKKTTYVYREGKKFDDRFQERRSRQQGQHAFRLIRYACAVLSVVVGRGRSVKSLRAANLTANAICRVLLRWIRFNDGRRDAYEIPAELERKMDEAIGHYPTEHKRSAALPLLHLWQEHFGFISDEGVSWIAAEARSATDQHSRAGHVLSDVPAGAGREDTYSRLPDPELCDGGRLPMMEKLGASWNSAPGLGGDGMHNPISVSPDGNTASNSSNASPVAAPRRFAWWTTNCSRTVDPEAAAELLCNRQSVIGNAETRREPPHPLERRLVFKNIGREDWTTDIDCYLRDGGYEQLKASGQNDARRRSSTK